MVVVAAPRDIVLPAHVEHEIGGLDLGHVTGARKIEGSQGFPQDGKGKDIVGMERAAMGNNLHPALPDRSRLLLQLYSR